MGRKLNEKELEKVRKLLLDGETPKAIADLFKVGVSSIYNYRNIFREQGYVFPTVKGKRPGVISTKRVQDPVNVINMMDIVKTEEGEFYQFVLSGTQILVPITAKVVRVINGRFEISFSEITEQTLVSRAQV